MRRSKTDWGRPSRYFLSKAAKSGSICIERLRAARDVFNLRLIDRDAKLFSRRQGERGIEISCGFPAHAAGKPFIHEVRDSTWRVSDAGNTCNDQPVAAFRGCGEHAARRGIKEFRDGFRS